MWARENLTFSVGQKVNIISDKAISKNQGNELDVVGNVVISQGKNILYGETANIKFLTGETEVIGNVRYTIPDVSMYGSKINYNLKSKNIFLENARLFSENFTISGKSITQNDPTLITIDEAEYTTCKDCPNSWSIYGNKVNVLVGKYVSIKNAVIKINGVVAMFFPYIVFPIKQKRESGLLFPTFTYSSVSGLRFQQPYFGVIDDYKDFTVTPSVFGNHGGGYEFQYRQNFAEKTSLVLNTLGVNDRQFMNGQNFFRDFTDLELHSSFSPQFNGHFYYVHTSDFEVMHDYSHFAENKLVGSEVGGGGFVEAHNKIFNFSVEGYDAKSLFSKSKTDNDPLMVQMRPRMILTSTPFNLFHTPYFGLRNFSVEWYSDVSRFRQGTYNYDGNLRNADRLNLLPRANLEIGNIGPVNLSQKIYGDAQLYKIREADGHMADFSKRTTVFVSEMKVEIEKIFGMPYIEVQNDISGTESEKASAFSSSIGGINRLPGIKEEVSKETEKIMHSSYRHSQEFILKHYYTTPDHVRGSSEFGSQIAEAAGQFDHYDAIRENEYLTNQLTATDSLPIANTLEFKWKNTVVKKTPLEVDPFKNGRYLIDNFEYATMAHLNISQGWDMKIKSQRMVDHLTRLFASTSLSLQEINLAIDEYYYYKTADHKFSFNMNHVLGSLEYGMTLTLDTFNDQINKKFDVNGTLKLSDLYSVSASSEYNIHTKVFDKNHSAITYSPTNNCYKIQFIYDQNLLEKTLGLVFYINYNDNNYMPFNIK